jgi:uncharacterized protein (TIGR03435 family)
LPTKELIGFAYNGNQAELTLREDQITGGPSWINSERYDIEAKVEDSRVKDAEQKLPFEQRANQIRLMVQSLLANRFKVKVSYTTKDVPVYALVVAKKDQDSHRPFHLAVLRAAALRNPKHSGR